MTAIRIAVAASFLWLGMVLAISFLEAPLKFRTPGVTVPTGLAIGRVVFRALNRVECLWALAIAITLVVDTPSAVATAVAIVAIVVLAVQLGGLRPRLNRRSDRILAGEELPRSRSHHGYVALEVVKVIALMTLGVELLSS